MYTKILVQNSSVSLEALQACLIVARAQFPLESSCFFLRSLLQSLALYLQKSKQLYSIYSVESIPTPSLTQSTPVGDGDQPPCLVTSRADEHTHTHIHPEPLQVHKKILSLLYQIKIQNILWSNISPSNHWHLHCSISFLSLILASLATKSCLRLCW